VKWMKSHKTEAALRLFQFGQPITIPEYIQNAVG